MKFSRLLTSNILSNFAVQVVNLGFPLAIQFYLVRTLDIAELANWYQVVAAYSIYALIISFAHLNLLRRTAKSNYIEYYLGAYFTISFGLMVFLLPVISFYLYYVIDIKAELLAISVIMFVTLPLSFEFYFQGKLLNRLILYRRVISKTLYLGSLLIFVNDTDDFIIFFSLSVFFLVFEHLWNFYHILVRQSIKFHYRLTKKILMSSLKYIPFNSTYNTLPNITLLIISNVLSQELVSYYAIFIRVMGVMTTFITSSVMVLMPYRLANGIDSNSDKLIILLKFSLSIVVVAFGIIFANYIVEFFTAKQLRSELLNEFRLILLYIPLHVIYNYYVFKWYVGPSILKIPILLSGMQLMIFCTSFYYIFYFYGLSEVAYTVVLSTLIMTMSLFLHRRWHGMKYDHLHI